MDCHSSLTYAWWWLRTKSLAHNTNKYGRPKTCRLPSPGNPSHKLPKIVFTLIDFPAEGHCRRLTTFRLNREAYIWGQTLLPVCSHRPPVRRKPANRPRANDAEELFVRQTGRRRLTQDRLSPSAGAGAGAARFRLTGARGALSWCARKVIGLFRTQLRWMIRAPSFLFFRERDAPIIRSDHLWSDRLHGRQTGRACWSADFCIFALAHLCHFIICGKCGTPSGRVRCEIGPAAVRARWPLFAETAPVLWAEPRQICPRQWAAHVTVRRAEAGPRRGAGRGGHCHGAPAATEPADFTDGAALTSAAAAADGPSSAICKIEGPKVGCPTAGPRCGGVIKDQSLLPLRSKK